MEGAAGTSESCEPRNPQCSLERRRAFATETGKRGAVSPLSDQGASPVPEAAGVACKNKRRCGFHGVNPAVPHHSESISDYSESTEESDPVRAMFDTMDKVVGGIKKLHRLGKNFQPLRNDIKTAISILQTHAYTMRRHRLQAEVKISTELRRDTNVVEIGTQANRATADGSTQTEEPTSTENRAKFIRSRIDGGLTHEAASTLITEQWPDEAFIGTAIQKGDFTASNVEVRVLLAHKIDVSNSIHSKLATMFPHVLYSLF